MPRSLEVKHLSKSYGQVEIFKDLTFSLPFGKCMAVLGSSGCGKSTLLRILSGMESQDRGDIYLGGQLINSWGIAQRKMVYLHQQAVLLPNMDVQGNIAFSLEGLKLSSSEKNQRVKHWMELTGLYEHRTKKIGALSGGQAQRVALARALVYQPEVLLLDEPFHALDHQLKWRLMEDISILFEKEGITSILVTHDPKEALYMAQYFTYMANGSLEVFPDRQSWIEDERIGITKEMNFWRKLES